MPFDSEPAGMFFAPLKKNLLEWHDMHGTLHVRDGFRQGRRMQFPKTQLRTVAEGIISK